MTLAVAKGRRGLRAASHTAAALCGACPPAAFPGPERWRSDSDDAETGRVLLLAAVVRVAVAASAVGSESGGAAVSIAVAWALRQVRPWPGKGGGSGRALRCADLHEVAREGRDVARGPVEAVEVGHRLYSHRARDLHLLLRVHFDDLHAVPVLIRELQQLRPQHTAEGSAPRGHSAPSEGCAVWREARKDQRCLISRRSARKTGSTTPAKASTA